MKPNRLPNRIFIKLLLSFWLCSSLIIATVGLLPLLQSDRHQRPIPPRLNTLLKQVASELQQTPRLLKSLKKNHRHRFKGINNKPVRIYLVDEYGQILNKKRISHAMQRFMLIAEEANKPISYQLKRELLFGPYKFSINGKSYSLYGQLAKMHPRAWLLFFIDNIFLTLTFAILLSGLLCALLAWHLGKPLTALKQCADAVAKGELSHRADKNTTARKDEIGQLALAFNTMASSIESMVMGQQRLISDISHELRTPLTRLHLALALARKKGQNSAEITRIGYEAEQLEAMIAELLELSRVKLNLHEQKYHLSLHETLDQVLDDAEFEAAQQHKTLHIGIDERLKLTMNPRYLTRAIENVLRNAIRYASKEISISARQQANQVLIEIIDDGQGISSSEDLQAIFTPFYRPQSARERESGGWGLGLAITKAAIDAHKGNIEASNVTPHGLKISISLPKGQPPEDS